ncbi:uncharacterized protein LOC124471101 [Hypomesus transpacificus]|uniref:uncharacterized protein LOC124471101 n=1 Tax=Hypomesus transpacificus TaxID=137520 RepID=UPI001F080ACC|nr:uncharacterized protein LOC124471101 [Hypomesus transpacificus]
MPPKREASESVGTQPNVKEMRISTEAEEDSGENAEEKYRISNDTIYPAFENEPIGFEDNEPSQGMRTDTISLLMKIDQLQAELKYERRCRIMAERELRQLKEMNDLMSQMRHTAHDLRSVLDQARQGTDGTSQSSEGEFFPCVIGQSEPVAEDDENLLHLSGGLRIQRNLYERVAEITDFRKYISALLMVLFDRDTLATHTLQGRRTNIAREDSQKPPLPPDILRGIMEHVRIKFGVDYSVIRTAIRTKLNNEDKLFKKRLGFR